MTDISALLRDLAARDIRITLKEDRLQINAPEGAVTTALREQIAAKKGEIITFLRESQAERETRFEMRPALKDRPLPLSFAQKRLWFLHQLNASDPVYNLGVSTKLLGNVDTTIVQRSIDTLATRHDALRTTFHETDGVPAQVVTSILPCVQHADLTDVQEEHKKAALKERIDVEVKRPFKLSEAPPVRVLLIRVERDVSVLLIVIHHIISDGWSLGLLVRQFNEIYDAYRADQTPSEVVYPWQYADYAYSEQVWFESTDQQPHIEYWKQKLGGSPASLDLPLDHAPGRILGSRGATHIFTIPPQIATQLRALSRQNGVTLFTTLLAIYKALLARYSGQSDIVVGTPVANRKTADLESLIGLFVSTIVLRTDLEGDPTFRELIRRVHDNVLDAHEHQDYPFEKLVDLVRPDRNLAQSPLFQTAFILQNTPLSHTYETTGGGATFELSLFVWDGGDDILASFEYNADLFDASTIVRMTGHFLTLAEVVGNDPNRRLSELPMLTTAERVQLLETWNDTTVSYPRQHTVQAVFEEQVDATPDAIALVVPEIQTQLTSPVLAQPHNGDIGDEGREPTTLLRLTYRQLDTRANDLARRLTGLGVTVGTNVGVAAGRSAEFVIATLAILKCGAAYVPVDPALPSDRLTAMFRDAGVRVILVLGADREFPDFEATVVPLDKLLAVGAHNNTESQEDSIDPSATRLPSVASAEDTAYVMYTSGSTGTPKGVAIPHRGIMRLVKNANYVTLTPSDRILACAPVSFDASTFEIWGSLLNGGTLVLYPQPIPEPAEIAQLVASYGITTLWLTAGLFHLMTETHPEGFTGLKQLLAGGDVLSPAHVRNALRALNGGVLINGYGPTENTTFTCCHRMSDPQDVPDSVPIGRPISNTRVYILDAYMRPVPIGVRGELWTGGDGLALGYLNDRALTDAKFRPDPFSKEPGARLYRTGDIARYRVDGVIEFVGRIDNQVKIRGFRVELGEIEHHVTTYPGVTDVAVVARANGEGHKQLVAYIVTKDQPISSAELKRFLNQSLPDYAIPSAVVCLDAFPLTPNGKVDYGALPAPATEHRHVEGPQTELEAKLLPIWEKVLGVQKIGRADNFFEIGGNSLLALQLLSNIEKTLGFRVPATVLFESQTVESMAQALSTDIEDVTSRAVPLHRGHGDRPPIFIVPGVNGNVIGYEKLAQAFGADQSVYGLRSVGLDGESEPLYRVESIASHLIADIRHVQPSGPYHIVGFCMGGIIAYEIARQLQSQGDDVPVLVLIDTWPPVAIPDRVWTSRFGQQVVFLWKGIKRHWAALKAQPSGTRIAYLRNKFGVVREMIEQRDVYRGETAVLYSDLVKRANQHAASNYTPPEYSGTGHLYLVNDRAVARFERDPRLYWKEMFQGGCSVDMVSGTDSGSLLRPPFVQEIADRLRRLVDASLASRDSSHAMVSVESEFGTPVSKSGSHADGPENERHERIQTPAPLT